MAYHMSFGAPWVYMSAYWRFGPFSRFWSAPRVRVFRILCLCFEPEPLLIKELNALGCFHAIAQSPCS